MEQNHQQPHGECFRLRPLLTVMLVCAEFMIFIVLLAPSLASAETLVVQRPEIFGQRLDFCARFGIQCGQPAARQYCRSFEGMGDAKDWQIENDIGARTPTRTILDGQPCAAGFCDGFRQVTCETLRDRGRVNAACSSSVIFTDRLFGDVRQITGSFVFRVRGDGIGEARNNVFLQRNDSRTYEMRLATPSRTVRFFCLNRGSWHREHITCARTAEKVRIHRIGGGGRKMRISCHSD